jgi:uncharacterized protein
MSAETKDRAGVYASLRPEIEKIHLVDAHNHLPKEETWLGWPDDWSDLLGYTATDLVNAGLPRDDLMLGLAADPRWRLDYGHDLQPDPRSPEERWALIKPYWRYIRHMGSADVTRTALKMFFGYDDLSDEAIPDIQARLPELKKPGAYHRYLKEQAKIDCVVGVAMSFEECPPTDLIAPQLYSDTYAAIQTRRDVYRLEQQTGQAIYSLKTYLHALDSLLDDWVGRGLVGIKWHIWSYLREMDFHLASEHDAGKALDKILQMPARGGSGASTAVGFDEMRPFQNLVLNHLVQRAIELDIPVQIHSATLGASYGGPLHGNPKDLVELFLRYPQARFDILHAGYPWTRELGAIAQIFGNVYINMAWLNILSPVSYKQFLLDWLKGIPINKIHAYGADQFAMPLTCACAKIVRDLVAEVLAGLVAEDEMTEDDALFVADCILRKNAWEHWKLGERWQGKHL